MEKTIKIEGMSCGHCAGSVKKKLESIDGVAAANVSIENKEAIVVLKKEVSIEVLKAAVKEVGYTPVN